METKTNLPTKAKQNTVQEMTTISVDATGQRLGRLASEIAVMLQGKNRADYAPNLSGSTVVMVENISKLEVSDAKKATKEYQNFSGYPGGLKVENMSKVIEKKGMGEILRKAVLGMLPKNKLQKVRMGNLVIKSDK